MGVKLQSALGGSVELNAPSTASNFTMTVPAGNGTVATTNQIMGFKNHIHNGGMGINQRNTVITTNLVPGGGFTAVTVDRWKAYGYNATGNFDAVLTTQQHNDHPVYGANGMCLRTLVTTADTVGSGVDFFVLRQDLEGFDTAHFYNKQLTLSFWVKTSTVGTYGVQLRATGTTDGLSTPNFISTYTVSSADTWEYKTISIPAQNLSTTQYSNGNGYALYMTLVSGQNESSPGGTGINNCLNQWGRFSSDGIAATTLSNTLTAATNRYFQLTDVQLEAGGSATPFEQRHYGTELAICQRYYQQCGRWHVQGYGYGAGTDGTGSAMMWATTMRTAPTVTKSAGDDGGSAADMVFNNITVYGCSPEAVTTNGSYGQWYIATVVADADL